MTKAINFNAAAKQAENGVPMAKAIAANTVDIAANILHRLAIHTTYTP